TGELHLPYSEYRRGVAHSTRLQMTSPTLQFITDIVWCQFQVDTLLGPECINGQLFARDCVEAFTERRDLFGADGESSRHRVTTVTLQQVVARNQRGMQVERLNAATTALADAIFESDQKGRSTKTFDDPR